MLNKTVLLTIFALLAFAANSVFCRLALGNEQIDAGSFTVIRLLSASVFLAIFFAIKVFYFNERTSTNIKTNEVLLAVDSASNNPSHSLNQSIKTPMSKGSWLNSLWLFLCLCLAKKRN